MSDELPPDEEGSLLKFIASTVKSTRDRVNSLSESVATKEELRAQTSAIRSDIEQVQLRLDSIERGLAVADGPNRGRPEQAAERRLPAI